MNIDAIQNGIVIDHISAGKGMQLYELLELGKLDCSVAIIKNSPSKKSGKKDIIKIDADIPVNLDVIGYVDPGVSVNIIRNGVLVEKRTIEMPELDILYMTRVQRERFFNEEDYLRLKDSYILTPEKLKTAKPDLCIMHPLPRVNEISVAVDDDPRACYFKQVLYGKYMRMALILKLLKEAGTL